MGNSEQDLHPLMQGSSRICLGTLLTGHRDSHLFSDIIITGVYTVSEQVFCAAITAAEVTVVEELSERSEG